MLPSGVQAQMEALEYSNDEDMIGDGPKSSHPLKVIRQSAVRMPTLVEGHIDYLGVLHRSRTKVTLVIPEVDRVTRTVVYSKIIEFSTYITTSFSRTDDKSKETRVFDIIIQATMFDLVARTEQSVTLSGAYPFEGKRKHMPEPPDVYYYFEDTEDYIELSAEALEEIEAFIGVPYYTKYEWFFGMDHFYTFYDDLFIRQGQVASSPLDFPRLGDRDYIVSELYHDGNRFNSLLASTGYRLQFVRSLSDLGLDRPERSALFQYLSNCQVNKHRRTFPREFDGNLAEFKQITYITAKYPMDPFGLDGPSHIVTLKVKFYSHTMANIGMTISYRFQYVDTNGYQEEGEERIGDIYKSDTYHLPVQDLDVYGKKESKRDLAKDLRKSFKEHLPLYQFDIYHLLRIIAGDFMDLNYQDYQYNRDDDSSDPKLCDDDDSRELTVMHTVHSKITLVIPQPLSQQQMSSDNNEDTPRVYTKIIEFSICMTAKITLDNDHSFQSGGQDLSLAPQDMIICATMYDMVARTEKSVVLCGATPREEGPVPEPSYYVSLSSFAENCRVALSAEALAEIENFAGVPYYSEHQWFFGIDHYIRIFTYFFVRPGDLYQPPIDFGRLGDRDYIVQQLDKDRHRFRSLLINTSHRYNILHRLQSLEDISGSDKHSIDLATDLRQSFNKALPLYHFDIHLLLRLVMGDLVNLDYQNDQHNLHTSQKNISTIEMYRQDDDVTPFNQEDLDKITLAMMKPSISFMSEDSNDALVGEINTDNVDKQVWLVKVPKYLADHWMFAGEGSEIGKLHFKSSSSLSLSISRANNESEEMQLTTTPSTENNPIKVFSEDLENALAFEGSVGLKVDIRMDINSAAYRELCKSRTTTYNTKTSQSKILEGHESITQLNKIQDPNKIQLSTAIYLPGRAGKKKSQDDKRERLPEEDLIDLIFKAFEVKNFWDLKGLTSYTDQPTAWLKQILQKICFLNKRGPNMNMYEI
eukprot:gene16339-19436_t